MHELGKAVPIIPVITKADTMTIREAQNYKQEVFSRLQVSTSKLHMTSAAALLAELFIAHKA
jgi:septin family protein